MFSFIYGFILLALQASDSLPEPPHDLPPPAPQLPIDDHIWILIIAGLSFGFYVVYNRNQTINKAS